MPHTTKHSPDIKELEKKSPPKSHSLPKKPTPPSDKSCRTGQRTTSQTVMLVGTQL